MITVEKTVAFDRWFLKIKDIRAKAKILFRIQKIQFDGHFGDCKSVGNGISELRIHYGKGYRVYFCLKQNTVLLLLVGGNKATQEEDIKKAKTIWKRIKEQK